MPQFARHCVGLTLAALVPLASGQTIPPGASETDAAGERTMLSSVADSLGRWWRWSDTQMRGIFDVFLPDTQETRTWRITLEPHFGDLIHRDHFRIPVGVIYGFSTRLEGSLELEPYVPNIFRDGSGSGFANIRAGAKYAWRPQLLNVTSAAVGVQMVRSVPGSPADLNDGVNRYSTYLTFARPSSFFRNVEEFVNLSYDFITPSSATGSIPEDEPQDDFVKISPGVLYRDGDVTYGLTLSWAHTVDGPREDFFSLTPSVVFMVPERYTFDSPGQWQLGAAVETKFYGGETDVSVRLRVRWYVDYRKALREWRENRRASSEARLNGAAP